MQTPATFPTKLRRLCKLGPHSPSVPSDGGVAHGDGWGCGWLVPEHGGGELDEPFVAQVVYWSRRAGGGGVCARLGSPASSGGSAGPAVTSSGSQLGLLSGSPGNSFGCPVLFCHPWDGVSGVRLFAELARPLPKVVHFLTAGTAAWPWGLSRLKSVAGCCQVQLSGWGFSSLPVKARQERVAPKSHAGTGAGASQMSLLAKASHCSGLCRQKSWIGLGVCRMSICHQTPTLHKLLS